MKGFPSRRTFSKNFERLQNVHYVPVLLCRRRSFLSPTPHRSPTLTEKVLVFRTSRRQRLRRRKKTLSGRKWKWHHARVLENSMQILVFNNIFVGILIYRYMFLVQRQFDAWLELECTAKQNGASNDSHEDHRRNWREYGHGNCHGNCFGNCTETVWQNSLAK